MFHGIERGDESDPAPTSMALSISMRRAAGGAAAQIAERMDRNGGGLQPVDRRLVDRGTWPSEPAQIGGSV